MKDKIFVKLGFIIPFIFWTTTIICGYIFTDYNHLTNIVSALGEIGTKSQFIFTTGLVLSAVLSVFFIIGLLKICKKNGLNKFPILIILTFTFSIAGAGLFPLPLRLHGILGSPSILLFLSPFFSIILWKVEKIPNIRIFATLSILIMSLGFLAFFPNILSSYPGLKQRFFHLGWSIWFIYLSSEFSKLNENEI
ncbi:DUF998 domain-containing protein [Lutibacter aestuarii]|uniref:DUF998 domain-containing protein n=1 Tax=Lutibacter aestuarii TaxID=861111 RepID=A0ABW2Z6K8_9FLAO